MPDRKAEQSFAVLPGPIVKFTIGSDPSRDYAECSDFTSAFTNTLIPDPFTSVVVEFHNDSGTDQAVFNTPFSIPTMPSNCGAFLVTVADDSWHLGDPTKGCCLKNTSSSTGIRMNVGGSIPKKIERLVFNSDGHFNSAGVGIIDQPTNVDSTDPYKQWIDQCIVTGGTTTNPARYMRGIDANTRPMAVTNCLVFDIVCNGAASSSFSFGIGGDDRLNVVNCTVDNVDFTNHSGAGNFGITGPTAGYIVRDNIVTNVDICYSVASTSINNIDDDGTGTATSSSTAEFVDAANDDYKLKAAAAAAGTIAIGRLGVDVTGAYRNSTVASDGGAFNNLAGYEQEAGGGGGGHILHPLNNSFHPLGS